MSKLPKKPLALDIGCAQGYVTLDRFTRLGEFGSVVGIDQDAKAIGIDAKQAPDNWSFEVASIEAANFKATLESILERNENMDKPVFAFMAYVLIHLDNPVQALTVLKSVLPSGSQIVIRTADDQAHLAYPDPDEYMQAILSPSMLNKMGGDRKHDRKLFSQLQESGFRNIEMLTQPIFISDLSITERQALFSINYAWRADGLIAKIEVGQASQKEKDELSFVKKGLAQLKIDIEDPSFFWFFSTFAAVASVP